MNQRPTSSAFNTWVWGLFALPLLFFALFYFFPLFAIIRLSFADGALVGLREILEREYYARILWFTTWQALASTILTILLALPGAYVFARYRFPGRDFLKAISTLPFVLPTIVVATAFLSLIGTNGIVNEVWRAFNNNDGRLVELEFTIWIILIAHVFYNYSIALRLISTYWQNLNPDLGEAAAMLGASPIQTFWKITLPNLWPAIRSAAVLIFIFCFTSFGVILILGGPRFSTLETEIYRQAVNIFDLPVAATLSLIQIGLTFVMMVMYTRSQASLATNSRLNSAQSTQKTVSNWTDAVVVWGNVALMIILLGAPLIALVWRSFATDDGLSLLYYRQLFINERGSIFFVPPIAAVWNSVRTALITTMMAIIMGTLSAWLVVRPGRFGRWLDPIFMLPLATSAVTLGFGFILALNRPPFDLRSSWILIPIAHTLVAQPFVMRAVLPALRRIPKNLPEAAAMLGASPWIVARRVIWPLIRSALLVGGVFAFTISMGEFGASVFISRPNNPTLPVAIFRFLGQPGSLNFGQALAMSTVLMGVCTAGFLLIERFRFGDEGEF